MNYRLDQFTFINANRSPDGVWPPLVVSQTADLRQRPGANGTDVRALGRKGTAFDWFTLVDANTLSAAADLFRDYQGIVMTGSPVELVWAGVDYRQKFDTLYQVLYCEALEMKAISAATGGLSSQMGAILRCRWELLPVAAS